MGHRARRHPRVLAGQLAGAIAAAAVVAWLFRPDPSSAADVVVRHTLTGPHESENEPEDIPAR